MSPGVDRGSVEAYEALRAEHNKLKAKYRELADEVRETVEAIEAGEAKPLVALRRLRKRVQYGGAREWSRDDILASAWEWAHRFGASPTASDWNPALLRRKGGDPEEVERFFSGDWPSTTTVVRRFGSWTAMLDAGELPRNDDKTGHIRHVRIEGDLNGLPVWTGWQLVEGFRQRQHIATHADLARRAGLSWATVRNIEAGMATNVTLRVFLALAVGLNVQPGALLDYRMPEGTDT